MNCLEFCITDRVNYHFAPKFACVKLRGHLRLFELA